MQKTLRLGLATLLTMVLAAGASGSEPSAEPSAEQVEFFEAKIRPVLAQHCYECHSGAADKLKGGLRVDTRQGLLDGGDSGPAVAARDTDSLLLSALRYDDLEMPPKGKLPDGVIADFERWLRMGAPDPRDGPAALAKKSIDYQQGLQFWAFQPPREAPPPKVNDTTWPKSDIDRFVLAKLEARQLRPAAAADRRVLLRRVHFDVIGLPPTPEQVESFVRDESTDAFQKVVDQLLASKHYGERWGRRWLDVARYGEDQAHTFKARNYPRGYYYRDWVIAALNQDMPYDRFLRYQIAGDLLDEPRLHEHLPALGLFALGPVYYQDNGEKAKALADEWDDRVDTLMRGVLGLTASCARCHDHKYDPISTADYYALAGVFASSQYQERPVVAPEVLRSRAQAEESQKQQQMVVDRFLAAQSKLVRDALVDDIPAYVEAAWRLHNQTKADGKQRKKILAQIAKQTSLSAVLIERWRAYLSDAKDAERPHLESWRALLAEQDAKLDLSGDAAELVKVREQSEQLRRLVAQLLPRRETLFHRYGENVAFVKPEDRADVPPGVIPLGNLFDDDKGASLESAVSSDRFLAAASDKRLGVQRVAAGWGDSVEIAPGVRMDFSKLGSDRNSYGAITNDGWHAEGGIRTTGQLLSAAAKRMEQGVGMHANALVTFDLDELRRAGLLPPDQRFVFRVDRAGVNDDTFGSPGPSAHLAVVVSRPHRQANVFDAVISGHVNGKPQGVAENDKVYYFDGVVPPPLKADGGFASFDVAIPAEAKFLTLIATGAGEGPGGNTISSDHTVFSGARLLMDPLPAAIEERPEAANSELDPETERRSLAEAKVLSEFFYDAGLLAIPPGESERYLDQQARLRLGQLRAELKDRQQAVAAILVPMAHALTEGKAQDLKIYLQGDPTKQGQLSPRAFPAIFTAGRRLPFDSAGSGRLELARAVVRRDNPLTARVIVNRLWRGHFGQGLVRTPSNFGQLGERPTHPELLDYLALRLVDSNWSLKSLHREILLSAVYQQSSEYDAEKHAIDPENRMLWRMNRRRLEVEPWRDAILSVAGNLDRALGGPSVDLDKADNHRRTVYGFVSRHRLNELLRLFDFPDPNITSAKRSATTVPLQQLFVLNSDFMLRQAQQLAARLRTAGDDDSQRVERAFTLLYARPPDDDERRSGLQFLTRAKENQQAGDQLTAWEQYALALLGANEFTFID